MTSQLLFLLRECRTIADYLKNDLEVILFLRDQTPEAKIKTLQERLTNHPWVSEARLLNKELALKQFEETHPNLKESVVFIGENPLPSSLHLRPTREGMTQLPLWNQEFSSFPEVEQIQYKSQQAKAILQMEIYIQSTQLSLLLSLCLLTLAGLLSLWRLFRLPQFSAVIPNILTQTVSSSLGARVGFAIDQ